MAREKVFYFLTFSDFTKGYEDEKSAKKFLQEFKEKAGADNV